MKQALYRKYRPQVFDDVLGRDNIVNILKNQIKTEKISHAYIFSGTRGTGKTTCAKIFAKAVNCLSPRDGNPCNECENCKSILEESTMDIIEMDAASNRRIEDIRQLKDKVIYPPTNLKYKVYIIDEAHMITNEGFNALLKIMEEPPSHLIFILATTEIEKIPDTILSRTQRFEFGKIDFDNIKLQLNRVLKSEDIHISEKGIDTIVEISQGAMRDALSVLDQVISIGKSDIDEDDVYDILGIISDEVKSEFSKMVFSKDLSSVIKILENEMKKGKDSHNFIKEILVHFRNLLLIKLGVNNVDENSLKDVSVERIVNIIDILCDYEQMMKKSDDPKLLLEIASIRISDFMPRKNLEAQIHSLEERVESLEDILRNGKFNMDPGINISTETEFEVYGKKTSEYKESGIENFEKDSKKQLDKFEESFKKTEYFENEKESNLIDVVKEYLITNYDFTNMIFDGLKDTKQRTDMLIYYVSEESFNFVEAMDFYIREAEKRFSEKLGKTLIIRIEKYKDDSGLFLDNESKMDLLKKVFPNDKINLK